MENKIKEIKEDMQEFGSELERVYQLSFKALEKRDKAYVLAIKLLFIANVILSAIVGMAVYYYATTTVVEESETTEQEGIYNFKDSKGNLVSSDLSLEEMRELVEINGKDKKNSKN